MSTALSVLSVIAAALVGKLFMDALPWGWIITLPLVSLWWAYEHHPFPRNCWQPFLQWIVLSFWVPSGILFMIAGALCAFLVLPLTTRLLLPTHTRSSFILQLSGSALAWHLTIILSSLLLGHTANSLLLPSSFTLLADSLTAIVGSVALVAGLCELERWIQRRPWPISLRPSL